MAHEEIHLLTYRITTAATATGAGCTARTVCASTHATLVSTFFNNLFHWRMTSLQWHSMACSRHVLCHRHKSYTISQLLQFHLASVCSHAASVLQNIPFQQCPMVFLTTWSTKSGQPGKLLLNGNVERYNAGTLHTTPQGSL